MDRSFVTENRVERDRIRSLVAQLTAADMAQDLGSGWTVSALLAHLAFWDRMWLQKFAAWERTGIVRARPSGPPVRVDALNDAMLPWCGPAHMTGNVFGYGDLGSERPEMARN